MVEALASDKKHIRPRSEAVVIHSTRTYSPEEFEAHTDEDPSISVPEEKRRRLLAGLKAITAESEAAPGT